MNPAKYGYAEADITPDAPVETIGFGRADEKSRGVLRPLLAQVCVWEFDERLCCLAAIDHIGFSREHAELLRREIGELLRASSEQVMLCFSHTHSAPNDSVETEWFESARAKILAGVERAAKNLSPCVAAWGNAEADIGVNRRSDGGGLDRRVGVLKVSDAKTGEPKLILLRLAAHANALKADNYLLSPDYFGAVRDLLKEKYGCPVMATEGASGNVAPKYYKSRFTPVDASDPERFVRSETALHDMAGEVLRAVDRVYEDLRPREIERLRMYFVHQALEAAVPPYGRALEIAEEARREAGIDGAAWLREVRRLLDAGVSRQTEDVELQYFQINDGCLCGVPNEIMCEFALRASERLQCDTFYLGGYTNGCTGYFPTEEEYDKGGYEVYWSMLVYYVYHGRVMPLDRDSASLLIGAAVRNAPEGLRKH